MSNPNTNFGSSNRGPFTESGSTNQGSSGGPGAPSSSSATGSTASSGASTLGERTGPRPSEAIARAASLGQEPVQRYSFRALVAMGFLGFAVGRIFSR
ncbi:hypothetical protein EV667_2756 [Ancylobacter aquaticus]|uniref:Uncharacterized protein n=1 Tax=Ancylobacter aquaticus TaxID=100 RepID=A0A4R1I0S1_ANCAQ|nr:hypothetical protein EV667_2756 [Ancylobacter aquaticus]